MAPPPPLFFSWAAFYGAVLGLLILSGNLSPSLLHLFCRAEAYTLGNFGQVWANWHAIGCLFVGLTNFAVARDDEESFKPKARAAVALNTAFIFLVWGVQNAYYCLNRQDLFVPLMWLNAILCLLTGAGALMTASSPGSGVKNQ